MAVSFAAAGCAGATPHAHDPTAGAYAVRADGTPLSSSELFDELSRADAVCIGERHDQLHDHEAQLAVLEGVLARSDSKQVGLGFEMFQAPFQQALDDYAAERIDERELLARTEYEKRWGFDFDFYRPLVEAGHDHRAKLLALNAPSDVTRDVARGGLDALDDATGDALPELDTSNAAHRAAFDEAMKDHPPHGDPERFYLAQVIWDETMAETASAWLRPPGRQIVVFAGIGHCHRSAIPDRIERRLPGRRAIAVRPIDAPADEAALADPSFDYGIVTPSADE